QLELPQPLTLHYFLTPQPSLRYRIIHTAPTSSQNAKKTQKKINPSFLNIKPPITMLLHEAPSQSMAFIYFPQSNRIFITD
ncbi:MAG: hypothetical protein Q8Q25_02975, partial [bacterium]|nr:hypothetical protein [bacterium]